MIKRILVGQYGTILVVINLLWFLFSFFCGNLDIYEYITCVGDRYWWIEHMFSEIYDRKCLLQSVLKYSSLKRVVTVIGSYLAATKLRVKYHRYSYKRPRLVSSRL